MRIESITSAQNPKVKELLALQEKSKERRKKGLFVVEGRRELLHCIEAEFEPHTLFVCRDILSDKDFDKILGAIEENFCGSTYPIVEISQQLYDKVAYRGGTEGVIAQMYCRNRSLKSLDLKKNPLVVILESVTVWREYELSNSKVAHTINASVICYNKTVETFGFY